MAKKFYWEELLAEVAKRIPPQQFRAWLESARFVGITDNFLIISAPTIFSRDWVNDHYREVFRQATAELYGIHIDLKVDVADGDQEAASLDSSAMLTVPRVPTTTPLMTPTLSPASSNESHDLPLFEFRSSTNNSTLDITEPSFERFGGGLENATSLTTSGIRPLAGETYEPIQVPAGEPVTPLAMRDMGTPMLRTLGQPVDPRHTFETFVVGASNQFAHAAARAVAEQPATQYNPLFLYSDAGLGKTHLLHAIGNYVLQMNPKAKVCYLSAEKFANDLIDSIQHGKMSQFREKYRDSYDMLLMDDIQFIAGKDRTQEEFFHTFNALHSSRRQIVVTSDKFPKDIPGLEDRIRTRFEWGLIADIQPPEIETRIAILRAKAEMDDIFLPNDVALFLASNIKSNIRELEGSLIRLGAQASLSGSEISLDLAKQLLRNIIKEPSASITVDAIQDAVSRHFSIKVSDLKSKERSRRVALPRQIAMYLIRKYCNKSYPDIGILLGGKDHSTILHGVKTIASEIERDPDLRRHVEEIQNVL